MAQSEMITMNYPESKNSDDDVDDDDKTSYTTYLGSRRDAATT